MTPDVKAPRFTAALDLLHRTGATTVQVRWSDDETPTVWIVVVGWNVDPSSGKPAPPGEVDGEPGFESAAALDPVTAAFRLCAEVIDGSRCLHCQRPAGFEPKSLDTMPLDKLVCWYQWDPENSTFRRGCEGDDGLYQGVGRNDPCPCGSGLKFKKCHGG